MNASSTPVSPINAMEFFQKSSGNWKSQRTTHHLAFRRSETGESNIQVIDLPATDPRVIEICQMHDYDPAKSIGGAYVTWEGSMGWDKDEEAHNGSTVFALVPSDATGREGVLLRERGYAEIVPVVGQYSMDADDSLVLITEYDSMSVIERFSFPSDNLRIRTSTVKRFGGFSTATFCTEFRVTENIAAGGEEPAIPVLALLG
jgi:CpeS-like protein